MRVLVVAEHDGRSLRAASLSCLSFARSVAKDTGGEASWLRAYAIWIMSVQRRVWPRCWSLIRPR